MTLQQCRYIVEIAKHSSITGAAGALFVTQPSLSKAIRELEKELGIQILSRNNKGVVFTKDGEELLFYAELLVSQAEAAFAHFNKQKQPGLKRLNISSQHYGFVVQSVEKLMQLFADSAYEITLKEGKTTNVILDVAENRSMIGVLSVSDINKMYLNREFAEKSLAFTPLQKVKQHVFLRKEHPLAKENSISLAQLAGYPYLTYQQNDMPLYFAEEPIDINAVKQVIFVADRGAMNDLLSNTNGYNLGTGCITKRYMPKNILAIPLSEANDIEIGYIKRKDTQFDAVADAFIQFITQALQEVM